MGFLLEGLRGLVATAVVDELVVCAADLMDSFAAWWLDRRYPKHFVHSSECELNPERRRVRI